MTLAAGVPTIWMGVLPELEGRDMSALRVIPSAAARPCRKRAVGGLPREDRPADPAGLGHDRDQPARLGRAHQVDARRPLRGRARRDPRRRSACSSLCVECRIVERESTEGLPWDGEAQGELQVRGPWIASELLRRRARRPTRSPRTAGCAPATSRRSTRDGYIRLVDRTKDVIKSGGEWISSVELENEIMAHPTVAEAAVIGVPDEKWGERPLACVVAEDGDDARPKEEVKRVPRRARGQVVAARRRGVHRRGARRRQRRQVLEEDAQGALRRVVSRMISATRSGCSHIGMWPAPSSETHSAVGSMRRRRT